MAAVDPSQGIPDRNTTETAVESQLMTESGVESVQSFYVQTFDEITCSRRVTCTYAYHSKLQEVQADTNVVAYKERNESMSREEVEKMRVCALQAAQAVIFRKICESRELRVEKDVGSASKHMKKERRSSLRDSQEESFL